GMAAWRGILAGAHPEVQVHERVTNQRLVIYAVLGVPDPGETQPPVLEGQRANDFAAVLGARHVVDAGGSRRIQVAGALDVDVDERGLAAPMLCRGVEGEDLGHLAAGSQPGQEPIGLACYRVGLRRVAEGEERADVPPDGLAGLAKAEVELTAPTAGDE